MSDWGGRAAWCWLDTDFLDGAGFAARWAQWAQDAHRPGVLHYVAILPAPPDPWRLHALLLARVALEPPFAVARWPTEPGFHRLEFCGGRVLLTLCIGPLQEMLREQQFVADGVRLGVAPDSRNSAEWDRWMVKALARLCRRGTQLQLSAPAPALMSGLRQAGFKPDAEGNLQTATYTPQWEPGTSRQPWRSPPPPPSHCVVVGAGLAGAAVAASLARRGWQVTVLDAWPSPAGGASGLPAGLLVPLVSRDDAARSRLSRAGVHLTQQWCHALLQAGEDWAPSGVRQLLSDGEPGADLWHADGAWVKPARLVAACLSRPGVSFVGSARVDRLLWDGGQWTLLDVDGKPLVQAPQVVLAGAAGTAVLLQACGDAPGQPAAARLALRDMPPVQGQISWGLRDAGADTQAFPATPVNGHGHLLPAVPVGRAMAWFAGATYEPSTEPPLEPQAAHAQNRRRLALLMPQAEAALAPAFDRGQVLAWRGTRCTTVDRLPGVGALERGTASRLWMSAGMGSRGLTYAILCAEILAARLGAEPLPIEDHLARLLAAGRPGLSDHL